MVIEDLSSDFTANKSSRIAPISDRVLSQVVDLALFSPLFSLCMSGLLRRLQDRYYSAPESNEFWVLMVLVIAGSLALAIITQGLFWSVLGATPGQMFFQLRVVRFGQRKFISLYSAWLRAFLFWIECAFFGLPFLEVFSHADRRVFHDRACESEVITLKTRGLERPLPVESRVIHAVFTACLALSMVWSFATFNQFYRQAQAGVYQEAELTDEGYLCSEVPRRDDAPRLDAAIAMFHVGQLSSDCLSSEIEFAFWKGENVDQAWASLATAVLNSHDKALQEAYLKQTCEKAKDSEPCYLSQWWSDQAGEELPSTSQSWTRAVLAMEHFERRGDIEAWEKQLKDLPDDFDLSEYIESERLKLLWAQNRTSEARGGYQVVWDQLTAPTKKQLATTFCFSELTRDCSVRKYSFCRDLEASLRETPGEDVKPEWVIALAEEKSCRKASEPSLLEFAHDLDTQSEWGKLLLALLPESGWTESQRVDELRRIAFGDRVSKLLRSRALTHLLQTSNDPSDFEKGQKILADRSFPGHIEISALLKPAREKQTGPAFEPARVPASAVPAAVPEAH